jgi:RNA polymerase sigma-70 factor (ECF subfamily)
VPREDFEALVAPHRGELERHCYRMLGSPQDAEDAVQEALTAAWRGFDGFAGRSSLRTWLFRIATHAALRVAEKRPPRLLSPDHGPPCEDPRELGEIVPGPVWLEPLADDPGTEYERRETVELAFVAALQHLPATQRAVLILREVLGFSAAEVAEQLDTSVPSVNSALQRARAALEQRLPERSQQAELAALGPGRTRKLLDAFMAAWERSDVPALLALLAADARFTMPPLPAWFDGPDAIERFLRERMFRTRWRLRGIAVNGQPGFLCEQEHDGRHRLGAINVLSLRDGRIAWIAGFVDPALHRHFQPDR